MRFSSSHRLVGGALAFVIVIGALPASAATLQRVKLFRGAPSGPAAPTNLTNLRGTLIFQSMTQAGFPSLWRSDGTRTGTHRLRTFQHLDVGRSGTNDFAVVRKTAFFVADDGGGLDLWKTDGTATGTRLVRDMGGAATDAPRQLEVAGDTLFFLYGRGVWTSDGTAEGTVLLHESADTVPTVRSLVALGSAVYFRDGEALWRSDGTPEGTAMVVGDIGSRGELTAAGGLLYFVTRQSDLWCSDGTAFGTRYLRTFPRIELRGLATVGGSVFFRASDRERGSEQLWTSDGTPSGTVLVPEKTGGPAAADPAEWVAGPQDALYVSARRSPSSGQTLFGLWKVEGGTIAPAWEVDVVGGPPRSLTRWGNKLLFLTEQAETGTEVWMTDGTAEGTRLLHDIAPGPGGSDPGQLTPVGRELFFVATGEPGDVGLWVVRRGPAQTGD